MGLGSRIQGLVFNTCRKVELRENWGEPGPTSVQKSPKLVPCWCLGSRTLDPKLPQVMQKIAVHAIQDVAAASNRAEGLDLTVRLQTRGTQTAKVHLVHRRRYKDLHMVERSKLEFRGGSTIPTPEGVGS